MVEWVAMFKLRLMEYSFGCKEKSHKEKSPTEKSPTTFDNRVEKSNTIFQTVERTP